MTSSVASARGCHNCRGQRHRKRDQHEGHTESSTLTSARCVLQDVAVVSSPSSVRRLV
jgi:hypothetical protein